MQNGDTCVRVCQTQGGMQLSLPAAYLCNVVLQNVGSLKYLRHIIKADFRDDEYMFERDAKLVSNILIMWFELLMEKWTYS